MTKARTVIEISTALAAELDKLAGPGHRSEFAAEVLQREVKRRRLMELLASPEPVWKDADYPELADGASAWVQRIRRDSDARVPAPE